MAALTAHGEVGPHGLSTRRGGGTPRLGEPLDQQQAASALRLRGHLQGHRRSRIVVTDHDANRLVALSDLQPGRSSGVNHGVGDQLADHKEHRVDESYQPPQSQSDRRASSRAFRTANSPSMGMLTLCATESSVGPDTSSCVSTSPPSQRRTAGNRVGCRSARDLGHLANPGHWAAACPDERHVRDQRLTRPGLPALT